MVEITIPENISEINSWKEDKEFVDYLASLGFDMSKFDADPAEITKLHNDYKAKKEAASEEKQAEQPEGEQKKDVLTVGADDKEESKEQTEEKGNVAENEDALKAWEKFAADHKYIFENTKAEGWEYSVNLYKTQADQEAKKPSSTIKGRGDNIAVMSDDLDVYREIARQAKAKGYTGLNLLDTLSDEQIQMMAVAALEQGLNLKGKTQKIDLNQKFLQNLDEKTKKIVSIYNNKIDTQAMTTKVNAVIEKAIEKAKEFKEKNPDAVMGYPQTDNHEIMALNIYAAKIAGCKIATPENPTFINFPIDKIKYLPSAHKTGLLEAVGEYNCALGTAFAKQAKEAIEKVEKGEKIDGIEKCVIGKKKGKKGADILGYKITEKDPVKRAVLFATIVAAQGKNASPANRPLVEPEIENIAQGVHIQYLPENLRAVLSDENFEPRKRQIDKIKEKRKSATGEDKEYFEAHEKLRSKESSKEDKASALEIVKKYQEKKRSQNK